MKGEVEMINVETWIIGITGHESNQPEFYYNTKKDIFQRQFNRQCAFFSKEDALEKEKELDLFIVDVIKGTIEVPKEELINTIVEAFEKQDLI